MNENETQSTEESVSTAEESTSKVETSETTAEKSSKGKYVAAILIVVVIIFGVLYLLEKEGRSSTTIFSSMIESQEANTVVAVVNGKEIINSDLDTSIKQFSQVAAAQGVDLTSPEVQADIRTQALDVLVNTELLKQSAAERGIEISDEDAAERLDAIKSDIGGEEVLSERMAELGISEDRLHQDIKDELLIQKLLDVVFAESEIVVTEEEVASVYESAGGTDAGLPALEEVREQIEAQIQTSKEQEVIDGYLNELKGGAEIDIQK